MVNVDRVKRKLPSLLCDQPTGSRANDDRCMRNRYRLARLQKRKPQRFDSLTNKLIMVLEEFDREIDS
jgi:hypothetical protein